MSDDINTNSLTDGQAEVIQKDWLLLGQHALNISRRDVHFGLAQNLGQPVANDLGIRWLGGVEHRHQSLLTTKAFGSLAWSVGGPSFLLLDRTESESIASLTHGTSLTNC